MYVLQRTFIHKGMKTRVNKTSFNSVISVFSVAQNDAAPVHPCTRGIHYVRINKKPRQWRGFNTKFNLRLARRDHHVYKCTIPGTSLIKFNLTFCLSK